MTTPVLYEVVGVLSDNWYRANPVGWRLTLDAALAQGRTLVDVIRDRYLELRDDVARQVFDEQGETCVIAWERAQAIRRVDEVDAPIFYEITRDQNAYESPV